VELGLEGRVAIVAAASKGLGKAVAYSLSREGARVAICARDPEILARTAEEIQRSSGAEVFHQPLDVTQPEAISRFVAAVEERFGRIDICVTNSGGPPSKPFRETSAGEWKAAAEQLLFSTVHFSREVLPRMQQNGWGRLITITSSAVRQPVDGLLLSNSLRAAVAGLAKTLATEYAPFGITVNNVCPGYTRTDRLDGLARSIAARSGIKQEEVFANWRKQIPAARLGTPEEFAAAVTFLASEPAAYINGVSLAVDGGLVRSLL
jgi:3-oxoacyl-[acyl-carrier protein] reductase